MLIIGCCLPVVYYYTIFLYCCNYGVGNHLFPLVKRCVVFSQHFILSPIHLLSFYLSITPIYTHTHKHTHTHTHTLSLTVRAWMVLAHSRNDLKLLPSAGPHSSENTAQSLPLFIAFFHTISPSLSLGSKCSVFIHSLPPSPQAILVWLFVFSFTVYSHTELDDCSSDIDTVVIVLTDLLSNLEIKYFP